MMRQVQAHTRARRSLRRGMSLGSVLLLPLLAAACSDEAGEPSEPEVGQEMTNNPPVDPCEQNPLIAGCPQSPTEDRMEDGEDMLGMQAPPVREEEEEPPPGEGELLAAGLEAQLDKYCGSCHGAEARANGTVQGRMDYIDSFDRMIEEGQIIPGNSRDSYAIQRLIDGSMPPASYPGPRPTDAELDQIVAFVDNPFINGAPPPPTCDDQLVSFDEIFEQIQTDVFRQDAEDRPFIRYLTLTNRYNAGVCAGQELDNERWGMNKLVNMLSNQTRVRTPIAIDPEETIYRVDIRHYGWDREVELNGEVFDDGWEALAATSPYAVIFEGTEAETVQGQILTDVPLLYSDAFVDAASIGNLYYALTDINVEESLDEFILGLGINVDDNFDEENVIRAGTQDSRISRQDRLTERHDIEIRSGAYWQSFDFLADEVNDDIFDDPFGFAAGGTEAIFSLPNGMFGFIIADADGNLVEESDILIDDRQNDFKARTAVSCSSCHGPGLLPVSDQVRNVVLANPLNYDADELEAVREIYLPEAEFQSFIERDSQIYRNALELADVPLNVSDPVSTTYIRFDRDMGLEDAAGDLGVSPELLRNNLARLDPQLAILGFGTLDRDDFTAQFIAALCVMQSSSQNRPAQAQCDEALSALEE